VAQLLVPLETQKVKVISASEKIVIIFSAFVTAQNFFGAVN
jgi:hypothetical protein